VQEEKCGDAGRNCPDVKLFYIILGLGPLGHFALVPIH